MYCRLEESSEDELTRGAEGVASEGLADKIPSLVTLCHDKIKLMMEIVQRSLANQKEQIESSLAQLDDHIQFVNKNLAQGVNGVKLMIATNVIGTIVAFLPKTSRKRTNCCVIGKGKHVATLEERSTVILQTHHCKLVDLECKLVSDILGIIQTCNVERAGNDLYEISYKPLVKGRHQLHIKCQGQHIGASPLSVAVKSHEMMVHLFHQIHQIHDPWGIAFNLRGEIVVTDWGRQCVCKFSLSGEILQTYVLPKDCFPSGITVSDQNIVIVDGYNHCIRMINMAGSPCKSWKIWNWKSLFLQPL
jgi:hypothetical protein